jgi:hypothetical protein
MNQKKMQDGPTPSRFRQAHNDISRAGILSKIAQFHEQRYNAR